MRFITFLLAIYILLLSIVPCSDTHNDCVTKDTQKKEIGTSHHDHNQDQDDNCSPFCTCSCCAMAYTVMNFSQYECKVLKEYTFSEKVAIPEESYHSNYYGNIWQPPKI